MKRTNGLRVKKFGSALNRTLFVTAIYALVGYAWIIGTELIVAKSHPESTEVFIISISKGLVFVTLTAILIFALVFTNLNKILRETNVRLKNESDLREAQHLAHIGSFSFHVDKGELEFSQ